MIDLDAVARAARRLEPLPASVTRLAALVCDGAPDLADVVEVVRCDQALAAAVLRTANSSWSGSRTAITTVDDAVVRLGSGPVLSLVLAVNVRSRFEAAVPEYGLAEGELWTHSVAASLAAEHLVWAAGRRLPSATTTAALLHDVGKLVMARFLDAELLLRVAQARDGGMTLPAAEAQVLGVDHGELGALVAQSWGLPLALVHGIGRHHAPDGDHGAIAAAVALADDVARSVCGQEPAEEPADDAAGPGCRRARAILGLDDAALGAVHRVVEERLDEVVARFAEPSPHR